MILFSGLWYSSRENSGIETKCLFCSKSDKTTVPADFVKSILKKIQLFKKKWNSKRKTNDVGALETAVDDSQSDDFSVTSVTYVLLELIRE